MLIEVYADVVCPWCYIGEHRLEQALARRPDLNVERAWRPFQLQPDLPEGGLPWSTFIERKFGGAERARAAFSQVTAIGAREGLRFDFNRVASAPNTRDAHRLIVLAGRYGREWDMARALFAGYFAEGCDLNDIEQLVARAHAVGLDAAETRAFLLGDEARGDVAASQDRAAALGIQGVPFFVIDGTYGLSGAQPLDVFLRVLDEVNTPA